MRGVRVALSSGDVFYVADASPGAVIAALGTRRTLTRIGDRYVNPAQVAQLSVEQIPSVSDQVEYLEVLNGVAVS